MNKTDYKLLSSQLKSLIEGEKDLAAILSNTSALLNQSLDNINWVGFYLLDGNQLVLGPFQGNVACYRIPVGQGVCGSAIELKRSLCVDNVHQFEGHIACDSASQSEIVIPLIINNKPIGVLDIDSPILARFTQHDVDGLALFVSELNNYIELALPLGELSYPNLLRN